jgi:hypothetical protein
MFESRKNIKFATVRTNVISNGEIRRLIRLVNLNIRNGVGIILQYYCSICNVEKKLIFYDLEYFKSKGCKKLALYLDSFLFQEPIVPKRIESNRWRFWSYNCSY